MRSSRDARRSLRTTACALSCAALLLACPTQEPDEDAGAGDQDAAADAGASDLGAQDVAADADSSSGTDASGGADATTSACAPGAGDCGAEVCRPNFLTGVLECQPAGGVALDGSCGGAGVDDCVAGAVCFDLFDEGSAICRPMCSADTSNLACPDGGQLCVPLWGQQDMGVCVGDDCTPPDTGCDSGERCGPFMGETLACLPAGTVEPGGDCSVDYCQAGYACVGEGTEYHCRALCQQATDCDSGTHCVWSEDTGVTWGICLLGCDLVTQTGCDPGEACYYSDPENGDTLCWTEGALAVGADCSNMEMCVPGADCFPDPATAPSYVYYCRAYCDDTHPCDSGTCQVTALMRGVGLCL